MLWYLWSNLAAIRNLYSFCVGKGAFCKELPVENTSTAPEGLSQKGDENLSVGVIVRTAGGGNIC